ncbi:MAG TPA: hypothetical protein VFG52_12415 [Xanthomonadales bacterium]|nr:hypothetical protein [Xanthomonadales bacterium]
MAGPAVPDRFRLSDLDLRDPHMFVDFLGCQDFTDTQFAGFSINNELQAGIQGDEEGDGFLDTSIILEFSPLDQSIAANAMAVGAANCTAPMAGTTCGPLITSQAATATLQTGSECLAPLVGTVKPYSPSVTTPGPVCFVSSSLTLTLDLAGLVVLTLTDAQIAASFDADPATALHSGLIRGFLSESVANATIFPNSIAILGGNSLASALPGGSGNCSSGDDRDVHNEVTGWWFYFNFQAQLLQPAAEEVFEDGFETVP